MAAHAWLDSLSEDWVSQHPSEGSIQLPPTAPSNAPSLPRPSLGPSRLPRGVNGKKSTLAGANSSGILSERSISDRNIPESLRAILSKPPSGGSTSSRSRKYLSRRSLSASSSAGSVIHNTVNHQSPSSTSPGKNKDAPEWQRRLLQGELPYGEQRDLFTSAATGLEDIFKPPPVAPAPAVIEEEDESEEQGNQAQGNSPAETPDFDTTIPSSPPVYRDNSTVEIHVDDSVSQLLPGETRHPGPRKTLYRQTDITTPEDSALYDSVQDAREQGQKIPQSYSQERSELNSADSFGAVSLPDAQAESRKFSKASTGSVLRNETFSPIFISKQSCEDGATKFAAVNMAPNELKKRLDKLRRNQVMITDPANMGDAEATAAGGKSSINIENTDDYEQIGGFVNFRRGGRSDDGSFRHRALSPELVGANTSEMFPESSLQASTPKQFPGSIRTVQSAYHGESPPLPKVPYPSPEKGGATLPRGPSGSPLKLFGPYDTFTNQTLMRRISQFEDQMTDSTRSSAAKTAGESSESEMDMPQKYGHRDSSAFFGKGCLDGYEFKDPYKYQSQPFSTLGSRTANGSNPVFSLSHSHDSSPAASDDLVINRQRRKSVTTPSSSRQGGHLRQASRKHVPATPDRHDSFSDSKRPRGSPAKDPTPKRRRTLHKTDISYVESPQQNMEAVQSSHRSMQSVMDKKRRDSHGADIQELAHPSVLANRHMLRPRTPTPSQRSSVQRDHNPFVEDAPDESDVFESEAHGRDFAARQSPMRPGDAPQEAERKPSIKTEDFLDEANKIMAFLRARSNPRSRLASVEESELENQDSQESREDSFQESTREPFSRPPSRDGPPLARQNNKQENPEVVEYLKKYAEQSDIGDIIGSSVRSLGLAQDAIRRLKEAEQQLQDSVAQSVAAARRNSQSEQPSQLQSQPSVVESGKARRNSEDEVIISDLSNVRISRNPSMSRTASYGDAASANRSDGFPTHGTASSGVSTGVSFPTASSRASDIRKTIAPETVSHLIPDQVGNMVLDRERNIWTKNRAEKPRPRPARVSNILPSEASEDDPFADIPDLTVDMTMEMQRLHLQNMQKALNVTQPQPVEHSSSPEGSPPRSPPRASLADFAEEPMPQPSGSGEKSGRGPTLITPAQSPFRVASPLQEEVEHEIKVNEGRGRASSIKKRNLTITFSSPVASIIQDVIADSSTEESSFQDQSLGDLSTESVQRGRHDLPGPGGAGGRSHSTAASRSRSRGSVRPMSMHGSQRFVPRPVSRIEERDEDSNTDAGLPEEQNEAKQLSVLPEDSVVAQPAQPTPRQANISFVLQTPGRRQAEAAAVMNQYVGNLSLSALSPFTVHHGERSAALEASYVVGDRRYVTGDGSKPVMSQSLRDLVARLTEFEPSEPYWEDLTDVQLNDKRLSSLHKLKDFCGKIVKLDVSKNSISNLGGVPPTVRFLNIADNQLSDLTPWGALTNIQHLDVSNNEIKTLAGLSGLVHLRNLRADGCNLTSLDGLMHHDGLQFLQARNNQIEELDFDKSNMTSLTELDLRNNKIRTVSRLERLGSLSILDLRKNSLEGLQVMDGKPMSSVKRLELDENELTSLDIKFWPQVKVIHADKNKLHTISGFGKATHLESLSLREQRGDRRLDITAFLGTACEVRKLYLSGNRLDGFEPSIDFLNLHQLELANCGLRKLPKHTARLMQNLRKLNLNFNALSDVSCLAGIPRLRKLALAGNRLASATDVVQVAETLPKLAELDMRDNPCTLGFYPTSRVIVREGDGVDDKDSSPFALAPGDLERDAAYCGRLDLETRMHRRLYEYIWVHKTERLSLLDGLPLDRDVMSVQDEVWSGLAANGLVEVSTVPSTPQREVSVMMAAQPAVSAKKRTRDESTSRSRSQRVTSEQHTTRGKQSTVTVTTRATVSDERKQRTVSSSRSESHSRRMEPTPPTPQPSREKDATVSLPVRTAVTEESRQRTSSASRSKSVSRDERQEQHSTMEKDATLDLTKRSVMSTKSQHSIVSTKSQHSVVSRRSQHSVASSRREPSFYDDEPCPSSSRSKDSTANLTTQSSMTVKTNREAGHTASESGSQPLPEQQRVESTLNVTKQSAVSEKSKRRVISITRSASGETEVHERQPSRDGSTATVTRRSVAGDERRSREASWTRTGEMGQADVPHQPQPSSRPLPQPNLLPTPQISVQQASSPNTRSLPEPPRAVPRSETPPPPEATRALRRSPKKQSSSEERTKRVRVRSHVDLDGEISFPAAALATLAAVMDDTRGKSTRAFASTGNSSSSKTNTSSRRRQEAASAAAGAREDTVTSVRRIKTSRSTTTHRVTTVHVERVDEHEEEYSEFGESARGEQTVSTRGEQTVTSRGEQTVSSRGDMTVSSRREETMSSRGAQEMHELTWGAEDTFA